MQNRIWILGASDPEMELIERILRQCGESVVYATDESGRRVHPGNAYRCPVPAVPESSTVYAVECIDELPAGWIRIDHHRPGDPGYGRPPNEFLPASSIGQVIAELGRLDLLGWPQAAWTGAVWFTAPCYVLAAPSAAKGARFEWVVADRRYVPTAYIFAAAADHCLAAAYRGECPGVDPDALMRWRIENRAAFQGRPPSDILNDIELAREALRKAPRIDLGAEPVCDMREAYTVRTVLVAPFTAGATVAASGTGDATFVVFGPRAEGSWNEGGHHVVVKRGVAELPDAAMREGVAYLAIAKDRDGRTRIIIGGHTTPETVRAFMDTWAPALRLVDIYGDPVRGFAGGYLRG